MAIAPSPLLIVVVAVTTTRHFLLLLVTPMPGVVSRGDGHRHVRETTRRNDRGKLRPGGTRITPNTSRLPLRRYHTTWAMAMAMAPSPLLIVVVAVTTTRHFLLFLL